MAKFSLSLLFFFFFLLSGYPTLWVAISHWLPPIALRASRPSLYPKQCSLRLPVQPPQAWASLLGAAVRRVICAFYLFILSSWLCCPLSFQNSQQTHWWEGFLVFGNFSSFITPSPSPGWFLVPDCFVCLFILCFFLSYLLCFVLPPLEDNGLPFWVPGVLHQHSEVVLWYLLSIQMIFQWIFERESGLPMLFLCHLRTAPCTWLFLIPGDDFNSLCWRM